MFLHHNINFFNLGLYSNENYPLLKAVEREFVRGEKFDPTVSLGCQDGPVCDVMSSAGHIKFSGILALFSLCVGFRLL